MPPVGFNNNLYRLQRSRVVPYLIRVLISPFQQQLYVCGRHHNLVHQTASSHPSGCIFRVRQSHEPINDFLWNLHLLPTAPVFITADRTRLTENTSWVVFSKRVPFVPSVSSSYSLMGLAAGCVKCFWLRRLFSCGNNPLGSICIKDGLTTSILFKNGLEIQFSYKSTE